MRIKSLLCGFILALLASSHAQADEKESCAMRWMMQPMNSQISFQGTQMASPFTGQFHAFQADICFDPDHLESARVKVDIDISSFDSGNADRDSSISDPAWFHIKAYPQATFVAKKFELKNANKYVASGDLTIKGVTLPIVLPFTLDITPMASGGNKKAEVKGQAILDRSMFGLGTGDWADKSIIANEVTVDIMLTAIHQTGK